MASWSRPDDEDRWLVVWAQCSQSNWDPFCGGKFTVEMLLGPRPVVAGGGTRRRLGRYLTEGDWQQWRLLRNAIAARAAQPPPSFLAGFPPTLLETYLGNFKPLPMVVPGNDIWFPYLVEEDVVTWGTFLKGLLVPALQAFVTEARQPDAKPF